MLRYKVKSHTPVCKYCEDNLRLAIYLWDRHGDYYMGRVKVILKYDQTRIGRAKDLFTML